MIRVLNDLAGLPLVERLGWTLTHFVWQAAVAAVIVAVALHAYRQVTANVRYVGLCLALLAVAAAPVATFLWLPSEPVASGSRAAPAMESPGVIDPVGRQRVARQRAPLAVDPMPQIDAGVDERPPATDTEHSRPAALFPRVIKAAAPWMVGVWMLGVGFFSLWHLAGWLLAWRLTRRGTRPAGAAAQAMLERLIRRMGIRKAVRLFESTAASVPLVVGWLQPVVLIPASGIL